MIVARKNGRRVIAVMLTEPVNGVIGIVQCEIDGCEANMPIMAKPVSAGISGHDEDEPGAQIHDFMEGHDCNPNRYPKRRPAQVGLRGGGRR